MHTLPKIFFKWTTAALYMAVLPVFFLAFSIAYDPFGMKDFLDMGRGLYTLNISILFAITLVVIAGLRSGLQLFRKARHFTWAHYISWCLGECLALALFFSMTCDTEEISTDSKKIPEKIAILLMLRHHQYHAGKHHNGAGYHIPRNGFLKQQRRPQHAPHNDNRLVGKGSRQRQLFQHLLDDFNRPLIALAF